MTIIQNFPRIFLDSHARWHRQHMNMGQLRSGDGVEFLSFHRNFIKVALEWYSNEGLNPRFVEPWRSIPSAIKRHPEWTRELQDAENRIVRNLSSFNSSDGLGRFLQTSSLNDAIHVIGSEVFNEPDFGRISRAPRSTLFYNWHGLIDTWWKQLERL